MNASPLLVVSFAAMALLLAAAFVLGVYRSAIRSGVVHDSARRHAAVAALGTGLWLALTGVAAARGWLTFDARPPTAMLLPSVMAALALAVGLSRVGERLAAGLPLWVLVGVQGFRFPLELMMHRAYTEGLMPEQMSYSGLNFDIVTGVTAILVAGALLLGRAPTGLVAAWNWLGFLLLLNIMTIAVLSTPTPLRVFMNEPANVWVTHFPFVWLIAVMVATALLGHVLVFRRLKSERLARRRVRAGALPGSGRRLVGLR